METLVSVDYHPARFIEEGARYRIVDTLGQVHSGQVLSRSDYFAHTVYVFVEYRAGDGRWVEIGVDEMVTRLSPPSVMEAAAQRGFTRPGLYRVEIADRAGSSSGTVRADSVLDLIAAIQSMWPADTDPAGVEITIEFVGES